MSTTTKNVAKAIAILSDVLSAEVENEPWTDSEEATEEEIEETVPLEDYEEVVEKSEDFSVDILSDLQNLRDDLALHIENEDCTKAVDVLNIELTTEDLTLISKINLLLGIALFNLENIAEARESFNQALSDKTTQEQAEWWLDHIKRKNEAAKNS